MRYQSCGLEQDTLTFPCVSREIQCQDRYQCIDSDAEAKIAEGAGVGFPLSFSLPLYLMQCHENYFAKGEVSGRLRPIWADVGVHLSWQRPVANDRSRFDTRLYSLPRIPTDSP